MYEQHFGLSSAPFQLIPDPSFYFDSRGHANALAYLKFGVYQGEGFIVVTGDIGAGKTTLLRTLLGSLDRERVAAAHVVSTQLESGDLLRTILGAFGVATSVQGKAEMLLALEGFLTALAARGRRALLIVDEAQNLSLQALEELRMLSNFQLGNHALLQSFLVGQPELRKLIESPSLEQLRQRVIASCHLGPMDMAETRAYIEHRLRKAGWAGRPGVDDAAFEAVHRATGGVPRRINLLCSRLLLGCYLGGSATIDGPMVVQVAADLRQEVGDTARVAAPPLRDAAGSAPAGADAPAPAEPLEAAATPVPLEGVPRGALLVLCDSFLGRMKAMALARAMPDKAPKLPAVTVVALLANRGGSADELARVFGTAPACVELGGAESAGFAGMAGSTLTRLGAVLLAVQPSAVLCLGSSDAMLAAGLLSRKQGLPLARLDAGQRRGDLADPDGFNAALLDRVADVLYTNRLAAHYALFRDGIASDRVHHVGSLADDLMHLALPHAQDPAGLLAGASAAKIGVRIAQGFALSVLSFGSAPFSADEAAAAVEMTRAIHVVLPVVWAVDEATHTWLLERRLDVKLRQAGVALVPLPGYLGQLGLLNGARAVLTGADRCLLEEAAVLGIPTLSAGMSMHAVPEEGGHRFVALDPARAVKAVRELCAQPPERDAGPPPAETTARIAEHLKTWLRKSRRAEPGGAPAAAR